MSVYGIISDYNQGQRPKDGLMRGEHREWVGICVWFMVCTVQGD